MIFFFGSLVFLRSITLPGEFLAWRYVANAGGHGMYQIAMEKPALWMSCVYPGDSPRKKLKTWILLKCLALKFGRNAFFGIKSLILFSIQICLMRRSPKPHRFWFTMFWWTLKRPAFLLARNNKPRFHETDVDADCFFIQKTPCFFSQKPSSNCEADDLEKVKRNCEGLKLIGIPPVEKDWKTY